MTADILREAAAEIREDYSAESMGMPTHDPFMYAVADWLDAVASRAEDVADTIGSPRVAASVVSNAVTGYTSALAVARAYLGRDA